MPFHSLAFCLSILCLLLLCRHCPGARARSLPTRSCVGAVNDVRKMRSRSGSGARRQRSMEPWVMSSPTFSCIFNKRRSHRFSTNFSKIFNKNLSNFIFNPRLGGKQRRRGHKGRERLLGKVKYERDILRVQGIVEEQKAHRKEVRERENSRARARESSPKIPKCSGL